jgi:hypothetical protein
MNKKAIFTARIKRGNISCGLDFPLTVAGIEATKAALGYSPNPTDFEIENDDSYIERFDSLIGVAPDNDECWDYIGGMSEYLVQFNRKQLNATKQLCSAFGLTFEDLSHFIAFISLVKGISKEEIAENGIPDVKNISEEKREI